MSCHLSPSTNQTPKKPEIEKPVNPPEIIPEKLKEAPPAPAPDIQPIPDPGIEIVPAPEILPPHESVIS